MKRLKAIWIITLKLDKVYYEVNLYYAFQSIIEKLGKIANKISFY